MFGILTVAIFLPAAMGLPVYVLGRRNIRLARLLGVGTTAAELVVTLIILGVFSYGIGGFQLAEKVDWASSFGLTCLLATSSASPRASYAAYSARFIMVFLFDRQKPDGLIQKLASQRPPGGIDCSSL